MPRKAKQKKERYRPLNYANLVEKKSCVYCGQVFVPVLDEIFCKNTECQSEHVAINGPSRVYNSISKQYVGAASELIVCADLLLNDFEVFRAVCHVGAGDLMAAKYGKFWKIDSTTGTAANGAIRHKAIDDNFRCDVLAVVVPHHDRRDCSRYYSIVYMPNILNYRSEEDLDF